MGRNISIIAKSGEYPVFSGQSRAYYDHDAGIWKAPIVPKGNTHSNRSKNPLYANFYNGLSSGVGVDTIWVDMPDQAPLKSELRTKEFSAYLRYYSYHTIASGEDVDDYLANAPFWVTLDINEMSEMSLP